MRQQYNLRSCEQACSPELRRRSHRRFRRSAGTRRRAAVPRQRAARAPRATEPRRRSRAPLRALRRCLAVDRVDDEAGRPAAIPTRRNAACRCRSLSACGTGIPSSPIRSRRCRARASGARSAFSPPRSAATRAARSIARTSTPRGRPRERRARRRRGRSTSPTGTRIPGSSRRMPTTFATRSSQLAGRASATTRGWSSRRTASRCRWPSAIRISGSSRRRRGGCATSRATSLVRPATGRWSIQSRSGRPEDPWLGPDVCDYLRDERGARALPAAVLAPIGFLCDHVEVLYDLDVEAAAVCREIGLPDGARQSGERSSALWRHDGGRGSRTRSSATRPAGRSCDGR